MVERAGALPLSAAQRGLWALDRIAPGRSDYLMPVLLRFRGHDGAVLRRALDELVARHEVLRTRYATADGDATVHGEADRANTHKNAEC